METQGPSVFPTVSWSKVLENSLETQEDKLSSHGSSLMYLCITHQ